MTTKTQGVVKTFIPARGYGFISPDDGSKDVFVHATSITDGAKLSVGDVVRFDVSQEMRGPKATNVEVLD
jgi:CspA family cold shock protein